MISFDLTGAIINKYTIFFSSLFTSSPWFSFEKIFFFFSEPHFREIIIFLPVFQVHRLYSVLFLFLSRVWFYRLYFPFPYLHLNQCWIFRLSHVFELNRWKRQSFGLKLKFKIRKNNFDLNKKNENLSIHRFAKYKFIAFSFSSNWNGKKKYGIFQQWYWEW